MMRFLFAFFSIVLLCGPAYGVGLSSGLRQEAHVASVTNAGTYLHPYGIKVRGEEVFVADTGGDCIDVHNKTTGEYLRSITYGTVPGPAGASHPYQLDFGSNGYLYVMDNNDNSCQIYVLDPATDGEATPINTFGSCGAGDGQWTATGTPIRGLVIYNDEVYVGDIDTGRIQVFNLAGTFQRKFLAYGPPTKGAYHLVVDPVREEIYVAEGVYIQVYDLVGTLKRTLSINGLVSTIQKIGWINGEIYASDGSSSLIYILDPITGNQKRRPFGVDAAGYCINEVTVGPDDLCKTSGQFNNPGECVIDGTYLYCADINNYRYQKFSYPHTLSINPNPLGFVDQTGVELSTEITSAAITLSGITTSVPISITGGTYDINASGSFTSSIGTVTYGDTVRARHTSSGSYLTATNTVVTVGGVSDTFTSTTTPECDTLFEQTTNNNDFMTWGRDLASDQVYMASNFTSTAIDTIYTVHIAMKKNNSPTFTGTIYLCQEAGSTTPQDDADCMAADSTIDVSTLTTSYVDKKFNFSSGYAVDTTANKYWVKLKASAVNATNYVVLGNNGTVSGKVIKSSPDDSTWANEDLAGQLTIRVRNCVE